MKKSLLLIASTFFMLNMFGQQCLTEVLLEERFKANPGLKEEAHRFMSNISTETVTRASDTLIIIPIVFHILHDNGFGNISEEQIKDAVRVLNLDMRRMNQDTASTRSPFKSQAADVNVEFRIAKLDPDGFCTNGITRHNKGQFSYDARDEVKRSSTGGVDAWPTDRYFNVWVVNSIQGSGEGTTLGYAQFPFGFSGGINETYGIVARQDYMGTIGTSNDDGRMLTHEVGHCLGLFHTFQGGCHGGACDSGGDYICDTPPTSAATYGCSFSQNSCGDVSGDPYTGDVADQIENYMSYDACTNMWSLDQKDRMRGVVTNNVSFFGQQQNIPEMENLTSPENLAATGVFLPGEPCQVVFSSNTQATCAGQTVQFNDFSFHNISSWNWTFPGGDPATSSEQNPTVTYNTPGTYDVQLTIGDSMGLTVDSVYTNFIAVAPADIISGNYSEGFESGTSLPAINWNAVNPDNDNVFWRVSTSAGYNSSQSLYLNNFNNNSDGNTDMLISESFDLSQYASSQAYFNYVQSYAVRNTTDKDEFRIEISNDCGVTWTSLFNKTGLSIGISSLANSSYTPTNWKDNLSIAIPNEFLTSGVKLRLTFVHGGGNNMYLDNFNINDFRVGINEFTNEVEMAVMPNPISDRANLFISTNEATTVEVVVVDMLGKQVLNLGAQQLVAGENKIAINASELNAGIYLLHVKNEQGLTTTQKVVVK